MGRYAIFCLIMLLTGRLSAQAYIFKNVQIRGGGYVSGIIYNTTRQNLVYARTDVGGAYRWNVADSSWIPLTDQLSLADQNYTGVLSLATDPVDTNRVYLATGLYTPSWAGNAAVFSSTDKGATWTGHDLTIKLGGNEDGRSVGERMQVDPNLNSILYLGTSQDGLWKSTDYGATWAQVSAFPKPTANVAFVQFKKSSGSGGSATPVIYIGLLQTGANFYKSTDGGTTWSVVATSGGPDTTTLMPHHVALSSSGMLYMTWSDNTGPNNVTAGSVWKWNTGTGAWTDISPSGYTMGGYAGITVDGSSSNTVMVSTIDRWWPQDEIYRSTNGGSSWTAVLSTATLNTSAAPYAAGQTPHWLGDVEIDPFNSAKGWFVTGFGAFSSNNVSSSPPTWNFSNTGLEETVPATLISPPSGAPLLSTLGDEDGFRHIDLDVSPAAGRYSPAYGTTVGLDFAQNNPDFVVRTHYGTGGNYGGYSTDNGQSWTDFGSYPSSATGAGAIAVSANGGTIVWSPNSASVSYSNNDGSSWTASAGINSGVAVVSDRVNNSKFYAYDATNGNVLVSTNGGAAFSNGATGFTAMPSYYLWACGIRTVFGIEGDVWLHNTDGLFHSTNSGASFTQVSNVGTTYQVAFGKEKTGGSYPAVYIAGYVSGIYGFYRSDDEGVSWTRINDDTHQYGNITAMAADPNTYGRIYIGTGGRGIIYGDINTALPLTITRFTVAATQGNGKELAFLQWQMTSGSPDIYYTVQRRMDGLAWTDIHTTQEEQYEDDITGLNGTIYYRLVITEADGTRQYSKVVSLDHGGLISGRSVTVYPNPVGAHACTIKVNLPKEASVGLEILDAGGTPVYRSGQVRMTAGSNLVTVPTLSRFPAGVYMVKVYNAEDNKMIGSAMFIK